MKTTFLLPFVILLVSGTAFADAPMPLMPPKVLGRARTIRFTATLYMKGKKEEVSVAYLARPNKAFVQDVDAKTRAVDTVYASNGTIQIEYRHSRNRYTKTAAPTRIADMDSRTVALSTLTDFLDPKAFAKFEPYKSRSLYRQPLGEQEGKRIVEWLQVDARTGLPRQEFITNSPRAAQSKPTSNVTERIVLTGWILNAPRDESKSAYTPFAYTPPPGAKLYIAPKLLANGTDAPDFTAHDRDGKPVHLSDYKGKIVVLDFWATWCGPCQMSLPHTSKIAQQDAGKDVVVLAVNVWDTPKAFQAWLPKHPQYDTLHFAIDPREDRDKGIASGLYGVSGIPTQYVIGKDGRIVKSIVGYEPGSADLEDGLKTAGIE